MPRWVRWALILIVAIYSTLGALHTVLVPLFEAPDEIWHFAFIEVMAREGVLPVQPTEGKDAWLRESGQPPLYHILCALLVAPFDTSDFPGFVRFNAAHPAVNAGSESDASNVFIHTPYEAYPYRGSVWVVHLLRLCGILWGAGTIVGVYWVAQEIAPGHPVLALTAAAITAFNPHFIFISSVINNDIAAACLCTVVLGLCIRLTRTRPRYGTVVVLGLSLGLALLSKVSALALLPLVALALSLAWWRDRNWRALIVRGAMILVLAGAVAGWWYVRNWVLYGDPLGWGVWLQDIGITRITLGELLRQFGHVFTSFWSPADGLYPRTVFWGLGLLLAGATVGWCVMIVRRLGRSRLLRRRDSWKGVSTEGLILAGGWLVLLFISLIRYMTTTPSAEGRLLFPGIASFSVLLVWGWEAVLPALWRRASAGVVIGGLLALSIASPVFAISPRYASPLVDAKRPLPEMTPLGVSWRGVYLLGVQVEPEGFETGDTIRVNLYWRAESSSLSALEAVVRLWTVGGRLLGQRQQIPAGESYPPDLWQAGDLVHDVYRIRVEEPGPAICSVMISAWDSDGTLGEVTTPALCELAPPTLSEQAIPHPLQYTLGNSVLLSGYDLRPGTASEGTGWTVTLFWRALGEIQESYAVFVHVVSADGGLIGQGDGPPLAGDYPTDRWSMGQVFADPHVISLTEDVPADVYLLVGLYRPTDGVRLPAHTSTGERVRDDAVRIDLDGWR
jgi:4-amino-4-deoxy-L-arabinose transferase-like glycosyltransferase